MLGKGRGGLCKAPTKDERRKRKAKGEGDKIKFINLRFEEAKIQEKSGYQKATLYYTPSKSSKRLDL